MASHSPLDQPLEGVLLPLHPLPCRCVWRLWTKVCYRSTMHVYLLPPGTQTSALQPACARASQK